MIGRRGDGPRVALVPAMSTHADAGEMIQSPTDSPRLPQKMPISEALVWLCALVGLGTYAVTGLFPQLLAR
jgi:hypothetical protein